MLKNNKWALAYIIGFLIVIIVPSILVNREEGKISEQENRVLASFPDLTENGKLSLSMDTWQEIENWFEDNIGFRDQLMYVGSHIKYNLFKQSSSEDVEIGKDGWLYYTLYNNIELAEGTYPLTDENLKQIGETQQQVSDRLAEQGIVFFVTLAPSKTTIYPEYIASSDCVVQKSANDIVKAYLEDNTNVNYIDLKQELLAAKDEDLVFAPDDVHWTAFGAYKAYNTILGAMDEKLGILTEAAPITYVAEMQIGDLSKMLGKDVLEPTYLEKSDLAVVNPTYNVASEEDILLTQLRELYPGSSIDVFYNANGNGRTLLMVGDSMFGNRSWNTPFAQNYSTYVYIWAERFDQDTIDLVKPDIVLFEITERGTLNLMYSEFTE